MRKLLLFLLVASLYPFTGAAQHRNTAYQAYINTYATMAQDQMRRYGIPASITLAQGLLESGAGQSTLATRANNHFGIKVTTEWTGPYVLRDDDRPNEKFRQYNSVAESYEDHSRFLCRPRYQKLHTLAADDYKGWAKGLKSCGYATNPAYANNLISLIELYNLQQYDRPLLQTAATTSSTSSVNQTANQSKQTTSVLHRVSELIRLCNGKRYVLARTGDTWKSLSRWYGVSETKLRKRNEYPDNVQPEAGSPIYLDKKASKASKQLKGYFHEVKDGESMHSISQLYGIKMKVLYKVNKLPDTYQPRPGDFLLLRK